MVYCAYQELFRSIMKILQTKITTIDDFSYSINVINKLFTLEQELVLALMNLNMKECKKSMRKKKN